MVHPKTRLMNDKTGGCSREHPYNLLAIKLLELLNSYSFIIQRQIYEKSANKKGVRFLSRTPLLLLLIRGIILLPQI